ncbi:ATP-binding cassette domain-containing protein [Phytohabitans sp. LJ34]|uniref:ATP-binding cassette domain-containing protein n=1 Tax=Phytohabitans sp. LJ34 TaxID=3452217 RepID=UPI003F8BB5AE
MGTPQWTIGRAGAGADLEVDDPSVHARHAMLEIDARGRWRVSEAAGRVFVNGARAARAVLDEGGTFVIGQTTVTASPMAFVDDRLRDTHAALSVSAGRGLSVEVREVTVARHGHILLDDVTLRIEAGEIVAVVGPSGAGKSSLIKLLLGEYQPLRGSVTIGGAQRGRASSGRQQVRYVPQSDDLFDDLTVAETLTLAARLRAAGDAPRDEVTGRVREALSWLSLVDRAGHRVGALSGGERRRVSIGTELVGRPQLLLLDEPTSGLDLGKDRDVMVRLRGISREYHCTTILVTHTVAHLDQADRLVLVGRGGRVRYSGPPVAPESLGHRGWADLLVDADRAPVRGAAAPARRPARRPRPRRTAGFTTTGFLDVLVRQATLVVRRGPKSLAMLTALPVVGTALAIVSSAGGLVPGPETTQVLSILVTVAALTGAALTYLDLVQERDILRRDWRIGVSAGKLLTAKVAVYTAACVVLSLAITLVYACARPLPTPALGLSPLLLLFGATFMTMVSSMGLGLLVSSLADSVEQAITYNTVLAICQVALNGALFKVPLWLTVLLPSRLGLGMVASYADLNTEWVVDGRQDPMFENGAVWVPLAVVLMALVGIWSTVLAVYRTERRWRG